MKSHFVSTRAVLALVVTALAGSTAGAQIRVPDDQPTINAAITAATPGDEVQVLSSHVDTDDPVTLSKDIVIRSYAAGYTTPAVGASLVRMLNSGGHEVTVDGLTIGSNSGDPAVRIDTTDGASMTLTNCTITKAGSNDGFALVGVNNVSLTLGGGTTVVAPGSGIAIYGGGGSHTITLDNASIDGCGGNGIFIGETTTLLGNNAAISNNARGIELFNNATIDLTDCSINGNATGGQGAGIQVEGGAAHSITLTGCELLGNSAGSEGGALRMHADGTLNMSNCIVAGNASSDVGGSCRVWADGGETINLNLVNCTFDANTGAANDRDGWVIDGGAGGTVNARLVNNLFTGHPGKAFEVGDYFADPTAVLTVDLLNNNFGPGGNALNNGATFPLNSNVNTTTLNPAYVSAAFDISLGSPVGGLGADQADVDGSAIGGGVITVPAADFDGDARPDGSARPDLGAQESSSPAKFAIVRVPADALTITDAFTGLTTGGEIRVRNDFTEPSAPLAIANDATIRSYEATYTTPTAGATVERIDNGGGYDVVVDGMLIDSASAFATIAVFGAGDGSFELVDCIINQTGGGAGIAVFGVTGYSFLLDGTALTASGANGIDDGGNEPTFVTLTNGASVDAGFIGIRLGGAGQATLTTGTAITSGDAAIAVIGGGGGAVSVSSATLAAGADGVSLNNATTVTLSLSEATLTADSSGIAIFGGGGNHTLDLQRTRIDGCGDNGMFIGETTTLTARETELTGNARGINLLGGNGSVLTLERSRVSDNTTTSGGAGAAFRLEAPCTLNLTNCIVSSNTATDEVGGIARIYGGAIDVNVLHCTFDGNDSTSTGNDGWAIDGGAASLVRARFANNLFTNHAGTAIEVGNAFSTDTATLVVDLLNNNNQSGGNFFFAGAGFDFNSNEGTVGFDPLYVTALHPFEISNQSPVGGLAATQAEIDASAIGTGILTVPTVDYDGDPRPNRGSTSDIGAQESAASNLPPTAARFWWAY